MNPRKRITSAKVEVEVELGKITVLDCLSMNGNLLKYVQVILTECLCSVESYVWWIISVWRSVIVIVHTFSSVHCKYWHEWWRCSRSLNISVIIVKTTTRPQLSLTWLKLGLTWIDLETPTHSTSAIYKLFLSPYWPNLNKTFYISKLCKIMLRYGKIFKNWYGLPIPIHPWGFIYGWFHLATAKICWYWWKMQHCNRVHF